jgi:Ca2+-binding RTX toxin-like protein
MPSIKIGTPGPDTIVHAPSPDGLYESYGLGGNDHLVAGPDGFSILDGGEGNNLYSASFPNGYQGTVQVFDGSGDSRANVGGGLYQLNMDGGNDVVTVTPPDGLGIRVADMGAGNDVYNGAAGLDFVNGGSGNDVLKGGAGNDTLVDGTGCDKLFGGAGQDKLTATADHAKDYLTGDGAGLPKAADVFVAGDSFVFDDCDKHSTKQAQCNVDHITDFQTGIDQIDLRAFSDLSETSQLHYGGNSGADAGLVWYTKHDGTDIAVFHLDNLVPTVDLTHDFLI